MNNHKQKETKPWISSLSLSFQLGYTIAVPLVVLALLGRFLDKKFDTSPWILLAGILLSLIISSWIIYIKIVQIISKLSDCEGKVKKIKEEKEK